MSLKCGIVGLPNVGKSTLFNALTRADIAAANYPFCTIEPNVGVVPVPDPRLDQLAQLAKPQRCVPTTVEFVDIAGLVAGAAQGEGLGNQFLSHIRETDALIHVVRCFEDDDIVHVANAIQPIDDVDTINTELLLADLDVAQNALEKARRRAKAGQPSHAAEVAALEHVVAQLERGDPVRTLTLDRDARDHLRDYRFITAKPVLYLANVAEDGFNNNPLLDALEQRARADQAHAVVPVCAALEGEMARLEPAERDEFLRDLGLDEPGLNRVIRAGYDLLTLQTFFTAGPQEVRAWTVQRGATAPQAAGRIHSDFEVGFIRAEIIAYDDYLDCGGEQGAKDRGKWRLEGKDYRMAEGDIAHFRFNV